MAAVRQRIPFRFSEDDEQEGHILDEQEQEEVLDRLRQESSNSNAHYLIGLQAIIALSLLLHLLYILRSPNRSPLAALFPDTPAAAPVPLATVFALLQAALHCNLSLNALPPDHQLRTGLRTLTTPPTLGLPLPFSHPITLFGPLVAPAYALILGRNWVDVLWWSIAGILTAIVYIVLKWMKEEEAEIANLEKLRYTARGA